MNYQFFLEREQNRSKIYGKREEKYENPYVIGIKVPSVTGQSSPDAEGKKNTGAHNARKIKIVSTGAVYTSVREAVEQLGSTYSKLKGMIQRGEAEYLTEVGKKIADPKTGQTYKTIQEAADFFGCSTKKIRRMIENGLLIKA